VKHVNNKPALIESLGLILDMRILDRAYKSCDEAEELKNTALRKGYESLGDMMVDQK
jgi:hypothetical protein